MTHHLGLLEPVKTDPRGLVVLVILNSGGV
jgi:hypothetical protein